MTLNYLLQNERQQLCLHSFYESLDGQWEYTAQPKNSFWCHVIDAKGAVLLFIFTNEFVFIVLYFLFSFRFLIELKLL